jgi:hypothetical protein
MCSPGDNVMNQFDVMNGNYSHLVVNSAGCYNMSFYQTPNTTVMTWIRQLNNSDPNDAQVSVGSDTSLMWAIGPGNTWSPDAKPFMGNTNLVLVNSTKDCVIEFGDGVTASFHFPTADTISFTVTLLGWQAWYVAECGCGCLVCMCFHLVVQAGSRVSDWLCPPNDWYGRRYWSA